MTMINFILVFLVLLAVAGCSSPDNHNNFNIVVGENQMTPETPKEEIKEQKEAEPQSHSRGRWRGMGNINKKTSYKGSLIPRTNMYLTLKTTPL